MPTATKPSTVSKPDHQTSPLLKSPPASASPAVTNPYAKKLAAASRVSFPLNLKSAPKAAPTPALKASKYSPSPSPSAPVLKTPAVFRDITQPQLYRINLSAPTTALGGSLRDAVPKNAKNVHLLTTPGLTKAQFLEDVNYSPFKDLLACLKAGSLKDTHGCSDPSSADFDTWCYVMECLSKNYNSTQTIWKAKGDYKLVKPFLFALRNTKPQQAPHWQTDPTGILHPSPLELAFLAALSVLGNVKPIMPQPKPQPKANTPAVQGFKLKGAKSTQPSRDRPQEASITDWSLVSSRRHNTTTEVTIFRLTGNAHKAFDPSNQADKNSLVNWIFQNVQAKLSRADPTFIWTYYPGFDNASLPANKWQPVTADTSPSGLPRGGWMLGKFIQGGYVRSNGEPLSGLIHVKHSIPAEELLSKFNDLGNLWEPHEDAESHMKLHRWQLQEPTYALCQWIFGSTEELDREALASALNKDPFLANHGISVEIVWHKLEIVPQEDTFGQRAVHAAHICCATERTAACETALDAIFAPSRKTGFPLDTIFRCFQNTGSDHVGMLSTKDKARSATLRELHRKQVQDSAKLVELYPHMLTPLNLPGSRTLKQFLQGRRTLDTRPLFLDISPTKDCEGYYTFTVLKEHKAEAREVLSSLVMLCREVHGDESKVWFTEDQWARCDETYFQDEAGRWISKTARSNAARANAFLIDFVQDDTLLQDEPVCVLAGLRDRPFKPPDIHAVRGPPRPRTSDGSTASTKQYTIGAVSTIGNLDEDTTIADDLNYQEARSTLEANMQDASNAMEEDSETLLQESLRFLPLLPAQLSQVISPLDFPPIGDSYGTNRSLDLCQQTESQLASALSERLSDIQFTIETVHSEQFFADLEKLSHSLHSDHCPEDLGEAALAHHRNLSLWHALIKLEIHTTPDEIKVQFTEWYQRCAAHSIAALASVFATTYLKNNQDKEPIFEEDGAYTFKLILPCTCLDEHLLDEMADHLKDSWIYNPSSETDEVSNPELIPLYLLWFYQIVHPGPHLEFSEYLHALSSPAFTPNHLRLSQHWFLHALPYPVLPCFESGEGRME